MSQIETKERIKDYLTALKPRKLRDGYNREAAVLMPVLKMENEYHFLLTKRTEQVQTHKGQISFPGGMREDNEPLVKTALRETFEEVGIEEDRVEILGRFHDYLSITEYRVTPFVGFIHEPFAIKPQVTEVAEVLKVPFPIFLDPVLLRVEKRNSQYWGKTYFFTYGANEIWGLTALIIKDFMDALHSHT